MSALYGSLLLGRFTPASKKPRTGFVRSSGFYAYASPTGNPYDLLHYTIYPTTLLARTLPPGNGPVPPAPPPIFTATGGTITDVGLYRLHTFTNAAASETFQVVFNPGNLTAVEMFLVGGGGGGGAWSGGGGGAGRVLRATYNMPPGAYTVTVGNGGGPGQIDISGPTGTPPSAGDASTIGNPIVFASAPGGGRGGNFDINAGGNGGSGGGGSISVQRGRGIVVSSTLTLGSIINDLGFNGGTGTTSGNSPGCGGGGAQGIGGGIPSPNVTTVRGGLGGNGYYYGRTGQFYGGGGGGGNGDGSIYAGPNDLATGGIGGGGAGAQWTPFFPFNANGTNGGVNTGGGGGGGYAGTIGNVFGGGGGSGIVILSYLIPLPRLPCLLLRCGRR